MIGVFYMKASSLPRYAFIGLAWLLLTINTYAADKGWMHVSSPLTVAGKQLTSGNYTIRWVGDGPNVELDIMRGKKKLATTMAVEKHLQNVSANNAVTITEEGSGNKKLSQIFLSGKDIVFEIVD